MAQQTTGTQYTDNPLRIEIPAHSVNETYRIIPCGPKGLIMLFRSQEVADETKTKWYFSLYDTNLQLVWVKSVPFLNDLDYRFQQSDADTMALLFLHSRVEITQGHFLLSDIIFLLIPQLRLSHLSIFLPPKIML